MRLNLQSRTILNNGVEMPMFGLGIWSIASGGPTQKVVKYALACGYRLIDTAKLYRNERDVGIAVKENDIPREEIFITTKLWNDDHGYNKAIKAFNESYKKIGLDYIDLYLIHWPESRLRGESWKALEKIFEEGKCRSIGVSNYTTRHLEELLNSSSVVPAVNQVEFSPFLYQKNLLGYCNKHDIKLEAYSPLTKGRRLGDPRLKNFAEKYGRSVAQILIRWALQHDVIVIPKSSNPKHILENSQVYDFEISLSDMKALDDLNENYHSTWDPADIK